MKKCTCTPETSGHDYKPNCTMGKKMRNFTDEYK